MRARRNALAADVVVVNHHLFFADVVLRDEGISELLPACNTVIFDEAHQLPETARMFFGETVSTRAAGRAGARRARWSCAPRAAPRPSSSALASRAGEGGARPAPRVRRDRGRASRGRQALALPGFRRLRSQLLQRALSAAARAARGAGRALRGPRRRARAARRARCAALARHARDRAPTTRCAGSRCSARRVQLHVTPLSSAELFQPADGRPSARLDLHLGDARGGRGLRPLHARARPAATPRRGAGRARSTSRARRCSTCRKGLPADPNDAGVHRGGGRGGAAGARGERRARLPALHHAARAAPGARAAARPHALSAAGAGHRLAQRAARALPRARQRGAARQPVVLGGRRRARRGAVGGGDRQAAVRAARRPGARRAHRGDPRARAAIRSPSCSCRRRCCSSSRAPAG